MSGDSRDKDRNDRSGRWRGQFRLKETVSRCRRSTKTVGKTRKRTTTTKEKQEKEGTGHKEKDQQEKQQTEDRGRRHIEEGTGEGER